MTVDDESSRTMLDTELGVTDDIEQGLDTWVVRKPVGHDYPDEVQSLQDLCRHLIKTRYEVPASIQRARQRRPEQVAKKPS